MFNLNFLTVPIIAALITFGFAVVTDYQTVFIDRVNVPSSVSGSSGFSTDVVISRLADEMREIEQEANSTAEARKLRLQGDRTIVSVLKAVRSVSYFESHPVVCPNPRWSAATV